MTETLVLASASPRRQELLREAGIAVAIHPAHIPEVRNPGEPATDYVSRLAAEKAAAVAEKFPGRYVLAADTTVVAGDEILEKPHDAADARRMLRTLSGREHRVITAVSLASPQGNIVTRSATTSVVFREISDKEIEDYIATGEPMDKAGAYAIQGGAGRWVQRTDGEYSNVVGLPMSLVREMLKEAGFL